MTEHQKRQDVQSHGSRAICAQCGTIYDPKRPSTHPQEECDDRRAMLDQDA